MRATYTHTHTHTCSRTYIRVYTHHLHAGRCAILYDFFFLEKAFNFLYLPSFAVLPRRTHHIHLLPLLLATLTKALKLAPAESLDHRLNSHRCPGRRGMQLNAATSKRVPPTQSRDITAPYIFADYIIPI